MFRCSQSSLENKKNRPREREHGIEMKNTRESEESGVEMMVARRKKRLITMAIGIRYTNIQINFPESILSCMAKQIKLKRATTTTNSLWTEIKWNANYANRWAHELTRARTKKMHETRNSDGMLKFILPFNFVQHTFCRSINFLYWPSTLRFACYIHTIHITHYVCRPIWNAMLPNQMMS